jgi:GntR family transcriptional regulator of vanillate catabolism
VSQTVSALLRLRDLILSGELAAGARVSELAVVDRLGVSRTPVRAALARLEEEGLLEPIPSGGYAVRGFRERDIDDAIELRGTLEGLAARLAAERGTGGLVLERMRQAARGMTELLAGGEMQAADFAAYVELNAAFHAALVDAADSPTLARQIDRVTSLPFASPSGFVMAQAAIPAARAILTIAQDQHLCAIEAIERGEGGRAEAIMREHARIARRNLRLVLATQDTLHLVPGSALIDARRRA